MKKIIALVLVSVLFVLTLTSCTKHKYDPVESTAEEKRVVMTLTLEGESYEVRYELYRALFLNLHSEIDGGDTSVYNGENKEEYIKKVDELIAKNASKIYAVFHLAQKLNIDLYSREIEEKIEKYITLSVDGGYDGDTYVQGFGGDYGKYLESLKKLNLNYSVQTLMLRYALGLEAIETYYAGNLDEEQFLPNAQLGKLEYTEEDVRAFYDSEHCVRVIRGFLSSELFTKERAKQIRDKMSEKNSEDEVVAYIIQFMTAGATEIKNGELIARYNLNAAYYSALVDAAFALESFEVSEPIEIVTGVRDGYHIVYRATKTDEFFEECYEDIAAVYVQNEIGKIISDTEKTLAEGVVASSILKEIDRASISMD